MPQIALTRVITADMLVLWVLIFVLVLLVLVILSSDVCISGMRIGVVVLKTRVANPVITIISRSTLVPFKVI